MPKIVSSPTILGGKKRISGTRISLDLIYNYVKDDNVEQLHQDYPHLSMFQIQTALQYLENLIKKQEGKIGLTNA